MVISYSTILEVYQKLLDNKMTFDEADRWAYEMVKLNDENKLHYDPINKESELWDLVMYLLGIDMPNIEYPYSNIVSFEDIISFLKKNNIEMSIDGELYVITK